MLGYFGIEGSKCAPTEDMIDAQIWKEIYKGNKVDDSDLKNSAPIEHALLAEYFGIQSSKCVLIEYTIGVQILL